MSQASYIGDPSYALELLDARPVIKANTTTTLSATYNPAIIAVPDVITATVAPVLPGAGTPNGGVVRFTIKFTPAGGSQGTTIVDVSLTAGTAQTSINPPGVGTYVITAQWLPVSNIDFNGSTTTTALVINANKAPTTTSVVTSGTPSISGWPVTFTATVTDPNSFGMPSGTVTFSVVGGSVLGTATSSGGTAALQTTAVPIGAWTIKATYGGDATYLNSSGTVSQGVQPTGINGPYTSTVSESGPTTSVVQTPTTFTATVTGDGTHGAPTGYVTWFIDGVAQTPNSPTLLTASGPNTATASITPTFVTTGPHGVLQVHGRPQYSGPKTSNTIIDNVTNLFDQHHSASTECVNQLRRRCHRLGRHRQGT